MPIIKRSKRTHPFVTIDKSILLNQQLSWKAKGILCYLLSLPDDWQIYITELTKHSTDGRTSTTSAMNELIKAGYIKRIQLKNDNGRFDGVEYHVHDEPMFDSPKSENLKSENRTLLNKDNNKRKILTNKEKNTKKEKTHDFEYHNLSDEFIKKIHEFLEYRKESKKPLRSKKSIQSKINSWNKEVVEHGEKLVMKSIDFSIENGYQGTNIKWIIKNENNEKRTDNTGSIYEDFAKSIGAEWNPIDENDPAHAWFFKSNQNGHQNR